jgi:uncharacterized membrane protein
MKLTNSRTKAMMIIGATVFLLSALRPVAVQAAAAPARASAEVIDPASLDYSVMLEAAVAKAAGQTAVSQTTPQVRTEVRLLTTEGVAWLTIDYN